jgi:hypothetical protein
MALIKHELDVLGQFIPLQALDDVKEYLHFYKIHLIIRKDRKSILGDYRPAHDGKPHTISVNSTLNKFQFLITLIHEVAHLVTFVEYGRKAQPHGQEWKNSFSKLLKRFIDKNIFPQDIEKALHQSLTNAAASTCSDLHLYRILLRYNENSQIILVEHLAVGDVFKTEKGSKYQIYAKRRTRYECIDIKTGKKYLFPGIFEVFKE